MSVPVPATDRTRSPPPGSTGSPGSVDVVVNTGSNLLEQALQPGLSRRVTKTTKKVGKKKIVTRWAQALDDGFAGADRDLPDRRPHVSTRMPQGKAKVPAGSGKAAAPGYVGASFQA